MQCQANRIHAAAYIDTDGGWNDGLLGRDHAAHGGADAMMHIRHGGDMAVNDGQLRYVEQLLDGVVFDVLGEHLHRDPALVQCNLYWHG